MTSSASILIRERSTRFAARSRPAASRSSNCPPNRSRSCGRIHSEERPAAGDPVLPQAALRLVQPERARPRERSPGELGVDAHLVQAVARLVNGAEQRHREVVGVVAGRQPDVAAPDRGGEGMLGLVEPPGAVGEGQLADQLLDELLLRLQREVSTEGILARGAVRRGLGHQRHEAVAQLGEDALHPLRRHLGLVLVEQRVVGMREAGEALVALGVLPRELDVPLEVGEEHREVRALLRLDPDVLGDRARPRHLGSEVRGDPEGLVPVAGDQPREVGRHGRPGSASPSSERTRSISRPISSAVNISCRTLARVASASARASAPAGGIMVRSSQASRDAARLRSWISPRRSRSSS